VIESATLTTWSQNTQIIKRQSYSQIILVITREASILILEDNL
jgi:hypothetical protein